MVINNTVTQTIGLSLDGATPKTNVVIKRVNSSPKLSVEITSACFDIEDKELKQALASLLQALMSQIRRNGKTYEEPGVVVQEIEVRAPIDNTPEDTPEDTPEGAESFRLAGLIREDPSNRFRVQLAAIRILHIHGNHVACTEEICSDAKATEEEAGKAES